MKTPRSSTRRSRGAMALRLGAGVSALALIAACGSSSDDDPATKASSVEFPAGTQEGVKAEGTPVKVGVINPEGGPAISHPETRESTEAAVKYANDNLGGIAGHPIEIVLCKHDEDAVTARACANQMVEEKVAAVLVTTTGNGDSMAPIITKAGIPYVSSSGSAASEMTSDNAAMWTGGFPGTLVSMAKYSAQKGFKDVTAFVINVPSAVAGAESFATPAFKAAGIDLKIVPVPLGLPDATPQVSAGLKDKPGGYIVIGDASMCTSVFKAAATLGTETPAMTIQACMDASTIKAVGAGLDGAAVFTAADVSGDNDEANLYKAVMAKYSPKTDVGGYATVGYGGMLGLVRATADLEGEPTSESIMAAIQSAKDVPLPLMPGATFTCDGTAVPGLKAVCSSSILVATAKDGEMTDPTLVE